MSPEIRNPIIPGFNPDPSCICVDGVFYLVTSSFLYFPAVPVYTSRDLKNWTHIGNVVNRNEQLDFSAARLRPGTQFSGGIWAPTIRYRDGVFYVITTLCYPHKDWDDYSRWDNVIFSSTDPLSGKWSDPVRFDYPGYDTSLFWDDDGKVYVQGSFYWRIRPEISQFEIDLKTGKSLSGEPKKLWSGTGGMAPEAPHLYKKDGQYYLLIAEGGTEFGHCATIAKAPSVWGPFEPCPSNPILHAPSKTSLFQTVGHADIFADTRSGHNGQWWVVCLASRVVADSYPIGRETVLVPVDWSGEWPVADLRPLDIPPTSVSPSGPHEWENLLSPPYHHLLYLRNPAPGSYTLPGPAETALTLRTSSTPLTAVLGSPTFLGVRQRHLHFECTATVALPASAAADLGLAVYLDHEHNFTLNLCGHEASLTRVVPDTDKGAFAKSTLASTRIDGKTDVVILRVCGTPTTYKFFVGKHENGDVSWEPLGEGSGKDVTGGFTGVILALYAVQKGQGDSANDDEPVSIVVKDWRYRSLGE